jgi:hypothetical protein
MYCHIKNYGVRMCELGVSEGPALGTFEHDGNTWLIEWWWWFLALQVRLSAPRSSFVVIQGLSLVCARNKSALSHNKRVSAGTCDVQNSGKRNTL